MASEGGEGAAQKSGMGPSHHDHPSEEEVPPSAQTGADVGGQAVGRVDICQFFLQGRCHFGSRCRLLHSGSPSETDAAEVKKKQSSEQDTEGKTKKSRKKKKAHKGADQSEELNSKEPSKKPRMRPAEDVVSRILWDPSLDPSDFSVGYLDRFLGVLERPFPEFSWDRDVCSCDFAEELALPQHRIKYFTYKGKRVWDRESRMDGVFGSAGGAVEPPFCAREDEREACLTEESALKDLGDAPEPEEDLQKCVDEPYSKNDRKTCTGESCSMDTGQQIQEQSLRKNTRDVECSRNTKTTAMNKDNAENEAEKRVSEDASELPALTAQLCLSRSDSNATEKAVGLEEEWKDSWDEDEQSAHLLMFHFISTDKVLTKLESLEQRSKSSRHRPTHFITFRIDSPAFIASFHRIRKEITAVLPISAPYWVSPETLHVTLCLLVLEGPQEVTMACEALRDFARRHRPVSLSLSCSPKLGHFVGRVLYLTLQPVSCIRSLNCHLQDLYKSKGWLHRHSLSMSYHLTLAKDRLVQKGRWVLRDRVHHRPPVTIESRAQNDLHIWL
ncbi:leukocyte receptor cluster member 9 isoform X1 [Arapaima gigas]